MIIRKNRNKLAIYFQYETIATMAFKKKMHATIDFHVRSYCTVNISPPFYHSSRITSTTSSTVVTSPCACPS